MMALVKKRTTSGDLQTGTDKATGVNKSIDSYSPPHTLLKNSKTKLHTNDYDFTSTGFQKNYMVFKLLKATSNVSFNTLIVPQPLPLIGASCKSKCTVMRAFRSSLGVVEDIINSIHKNLNTKQ